MDPITPQQEGQPPVLPDKHFLNKKLIMTLVVLVLLGAGAYAGIWYWQKQQMANKVVQTFTPRPTQRFPGTLYKNEYMTVTIPDGWKLSEGTRTIQNQTYDKNTGKITLIGPPIVEKTGAVNIVKGNYILYINPWAGQASGIQGGRFGEIAGGALSVMAVAEDPSAGVICGSSDSPPVFTNMDQNPHSRVDLYTSQEQRNYCNRPASGKEAWYFSYITDIKDSTYFNYYKDGEALSFVITMAYNSKDINKLPLKNSEELTTMLSEMSNIIKTAEFYNSNWETYSSDQYGFEFKHPFAWAKIITTPATVGDYLPIGRNFVAIYPDSYPAQDLNARIDVFPVPEAQVLKEDQYIKDETKGGDVMKNGFIWNQYNTPNGKVFFLEIGGKTYEVSGRTDVVNQILSTFKFTK